MTRLACLLVVTALLHQPSGPPYSPQQSMATFRLEPGFRIELVASEPDIASPVAMDIDEDGRWFVVEMPGYPLDKSPTGRVRLLEDTNGDGKPDRSSVFADGLVLPTGVMRWKRGVLVSAAPDLIYFEDADGDGRADSRTVMVTGFAVTNPQHSVNDPVYSLDNWITVAYSGGGGALIFPELFGDRGKPLTFPGSPAVPGVEARSRSVRIQFDPPRIERRSGDTQFGNTFDPWGRYFTSENADHIRHEVVAARYLERNPQLPVSAATEMISDHGAAAHVFPITINPRYELLTESGEFTSACALTYYNGGLFTGDYARSTFVAEPVHNLVHRDVLSPHGATFTARRGAEGREFLAATDNWFRPVNFYVGPDGALYVIDYYRARIEHPEWTASEYHTNPAEFSLGRDRGRIYRIVPDGPVRTAVPRLGAATPAALVAALANPNLWWRRTAQRLLLDRRPPQATPLLEALARNGGLPIGRLHALWTLDGLGMLDETLIARALGADEPGLRENALQLAQTRLDSPVLQAAVLARAVVESDARVRYQLLATLGAIDTVESRTAQQTLLFEHLDDRWMHVAALSAGPDRAPTYLDVAMGDTARSKPSDGGASFFTLAASAVAATGDRDRLNHFVERVAAGGVTDAWWQAAMLEGFRKGLRDKDARLLDKSRANLLTLVRNADPAVRRGSLSLLKKTGLGDGPGVSSTLAHALAEAGDQALAPDVRADAIGLLTLRGVASHEAEFKAWVNPREPEAVQAAALAALSTVPGEAVGTFALQVWPTLTPRARSEAIDLLLADPARERMLVAALKAGTVQSWAMSFWQKRDLIMHRDPAVRAAARELLEEHPADRAAVANRYAAAVEKGGDAGRGEAVFQRVCAACHKVGDGTPADLGPDLSGIRHRPPLALLVDVLSPSQAIAQGYETYVIERADGRTEAGTLADQTPTTVTLRQAGQLVAIPRHDIRQMTMLAQSSMPADLDKVIAPAEMADLLTYLTRR